jgi:hypothetical protein
MKHLVTVALLFGWSVGASAFQPRTGHWFNPNESGRGFNLDFQDGVVVVTFYSYNEDGSPQWYLASGNATNGGRSFSAQLGRYRYGQCLQCNYNGSPSNDGSDGAITINFASETSATVTLPGGHVTTIQPFNFGFGAPPDGLLGQWVFVDRIGTSDFADRYTFTQKVAGTSDGNGIALDPSGRAACELQVVGSLAGTVVCVHFTAGGDPIEGYSWRYGLDETFDGHWHNSTATSSYPMKGFKVVSETGIPKSSARDPAAESNLLAAKEAAASNDTKAAAEAAALRAIMQEMARRLLR